MLKGWSRGGGLNPGPAVYETAALPAELPRPWSTKKYSSHLLRTGSLTSTANPGFWAGLPVLALPLGVVPFLPAEAE
jgi:hypothetical protein